jgi:hypothetical protein
MRFVRYSALEPNVIFLDNQTMDAQVAATLLPAKAGAFTVSAVGVVAMMLASIGLYGVSFVDPIAWSTVLFLVAAMANLIPARRASVVDPSSALRPE